MRIAVDFDGTIVENQYPAIGVEKPFAVRTLKRLASEGDELILWTARSGQYLQDAVEWCEQNGLTFFAVNSNYHKCIKHQNGFSGARKIQADIFIDDRNIGGFPGWPAVYAKIARLKRKINREFSMEDRSRISSILNKVSLYIWSQAHYRKNYASAIYSSASRSRK